MGVSGVGFYGKGFGFLRTRLTSFGCGCSLEAIYQDCLGYSLGFLGVSGFSLFKSDLVYIMPLLDRVLHGFSKGLTGVFEKPAGSLGLEV